MSKWFITLFILFGSLGALAQSFYDQYHDRRWIASAGTGTTTYFGELANSGKFFDTRPNLGIGLERKVSSRWAVRSEFAWFQIDGADTEADDPGRKVRNLSFKSNNFELNAVAMFGIFREGKRFYMRRAVNPYVFAGIGLTWFNPKADYEGVTYALRKYVTEDVEYGRTTFIIPAGIGVKFKILNQLNINLEGGYRTTFSDYLDDVSTVYINTEDIEDPVRVGLVDRRVELGDPPAEPGSKRGNPDARDGYAMINIKAEYYLPTGLIFKPKDPSGSGNKKYRKMKQ